MIKYFNFGHTFRDFKNDINNADDEKDLSFVKQFINLYLFKDVLKISVFAISKLCCYCKIIYGKQILRLITNLKTNI